MEETGYNITNKELKHLGKLEQEVYNISVIASYFCKTQPEVEECYNLTAILEYLFQKADLLNAFFINLKNLSDNNI